MTEWMRPSTLDAALKLLADAAPGHYQIISGGTDVMVTQQAVASGRACRAWLDVSAIPELKKVENTPEGIRIGAGVALSVLRRHPLIQKHWPMLAASAAVTGAAPIQNRATLGGNICNASPAADNSPVLLAYGAYLETAGRLARRNLAYDCFHIGYRQTALAADELLTAIVIPYPPQGVLSYYRKVGTRAAQAIAKVGVAVMIHTKNQCLITEARFGLASVAATPCTLPAVSDYLQGKDIHSLQETMVREKVRSDIAPIKDIRSTAEYRLEIASRLVWHAIHYAQ